MDALSENRRPNWLDYSGVNRCLSVFSQVTVRLPVKLVIWIQIVLLCSSVGLTCFAAGLCYEQRLQETRFERMPVGEQFRYYESQVEQLKIRIRKETNGN